MQSDSDSSTKIFLKYFILCWHFSIKCSLNTQNSCRNDVNSSCRLRDSPDVAPHLTSTANTRTRRGGGELSELKCDCDAVQEERLCWQQAEHRAALTFLVFPASSTSRSIEGIDIWIIAKPPSDKPRPNFCAVQTPCFASRNWNNVPARTRSALCLLLRSTYKLIEQTPAGKRIQAR